MTNSTSTPVIQPLVALARAAACFDLAIEPAQLAHQLGLTPRKSTASRCAVVLVGSVYAPERSINSLNAWGIWHYPFCSVMAHSGMCYWR